MVACKRVRCLRAGLQVCLYTDVLATLSHCVQLCVHASVSFQAFLRAGVFACRRAYVQVHLLAGVRTFFVHACFRVSGMAFRRAIVLAFKRSSVLACTLACEQACLSSSVLACLLACLQVCLPANLLACTRDCVQA